MHGTQRWARVASLAAATALVAGSLVANAASAQEPKTVGLWTHSAGNPAEMENINKWIEEFNASQTDWKLEVQAFPQGAYNETVVAAALSNSLPCILDVDGPNVPNWAWSGYLKELNIPQETLDQFLESTHGYWNGKLYAQGQFDAAVAIFALKSDLESFGIRIPTLDAPWTADEFNAALQAYKDSGKFEYPIDLGTAWTGEWYPYGFSPLLQSFGGDLIDRSTYLTAEGALNGDAAIAWGEWWQSLFANGMAPGTSQAGADRDSGFVDRKYGMAWNGVWAATPVIEKFGDDALFLPAPDLGTGAKIGGASWQWAASASCDAPEAADAWIDFILDPARVASIADAQTTIPGSDAAKALSTKFGEGGPLAIFYELSKAQAVIRPPTPAYTTIAKVFEKAAADIANGADVAGTLDAAVDEIDADIEANDGYGF